MIASLVEFLDDFGPSWFFIGLGALLVILYVLLSWTFKDEWKELNDRLGYWEIRKKKEK